MEENITTSEALKWLRQRFSEPCPKTCGAPYSSRDAQLSFQYPARPNNMATGAGRVSKDGKFEDDGRVLERYPCSEMVVVLEQSLYIKA